MGEKRTYYAEHVKRLQDQVVQHMEQDYEFVCITDSPFPGWWAKISLFEPGRFSGRVLYLDLDVTISGGLDDLVNFPYEFAAIRDYQHPLRVNSSVMVWDSEIADHLFTEFKPEVMKRLHGDQNWIHEKQSSMMFPKRWCQSYKLQKFKGEVMDDLRVMVYHGSPKPWEVAE